MNILALGAHPDDIDLSCGGTLLRYAKQGHRLFLCVMTDGRTGSRRVMDGEALVETRRQEQAEAARGYGGAQLKMLGFGDGQLFADGPTLLETIDAIRWASPDIILTHDPADHNTDHRSAGELVVRALYYLTLGNVRVPTPAMQKAPMVFFWDTYAGIGNQPAAYVDITDEVEEKRAIVACHKSQMTDEFDWLELSEVVTRYRGMQCGTQYAEGFTGYQAYSAMPDYRLLP